MMESALSGQNDWQAPPILNTDTRMVAVMNPAGASVTAQGFERSEPATAPFVMPARHATETREGAAKRINPRGDDSRNADRNIGA
jgi:hypothetical protein